MIPYTDAQDKRILLSVFFGLSQRFIYGSTGTHDFLLVFGDGNPRAWPNVSKKRLVQDFNGRHSLSFSLSLMLRGHHVAKMPSTDDFRTF